MVVRTPTVLQMEATECGAASLSIILQHHGKYVPLAQLRELCGVSRDGSDAANLVLAARSLGLTAKGFKKGLEALAAVKPPVIVFWEFNHFLVFEGFQGDRVVLNDPALGPRSVSREDFDRSYTGIVLTMEPNDSFQPGGNGPIPLADRVAAAAVRTGRGPVHHHRRPGADPAATGDADLLPDLPG